MNTKCIVSGIAALALSALLFTACSNENDPTPTISSQYVTVAPTVTGEVITKAGSSYGQTGDKLYLYYNTAGNATPDQYADFRYDGAIWNLGTNTMKWATIHEAATSTGASTIPFYATAPVVAPVTGTPTKVETDQSITDNYKNSDLLVAYKSITKAGAPTGYTALSIDLKHALAKLTIEVNAKALEDAVINSVTIKDAVADYTVSYNPSEATPATTDVDGSNKTNIKPLQSGSVFSAVLPVQNIQKANGITIVIAVGEKTFIYQPEAAISLQQGKNTTLKLRLNGTGVVLGDVTVSDWGTGDTKDDNIAAD